MEEVFMKKQKDDELLDLVDRNDRVIGTVWKSEAHGDPTKIHREIAVLIFNTKDETLLQKRSLAKSHDPGVWTVAVSGHVGAGEDYLKAAERELKEELGIESDLKFYKKIFSKRGNREARFFYIYYATFDREPAIKFNKKEVEQVKWVKVDNLINFAKDNKYNLKGLSHKYTRKIYSEKVKTKII
jgi:isopentenyl-diphosphate delta-isomerase type 1